jgi:transcriptional regulator with XRE-family HTH domain
MFESISLPDAVWRTKAAGEALRARDAAGLLRLAHRHGASQHRIANAVGILQGRVSEILRGQRQVEALEVFERIADGLAMPDHARMVLGLAPRADRDQGRSAKLSGEIVRVFANQAAAANDIQATAKTASRVDVLAVRALGIIGMKDSLLRPAFADADGDVSARVLLLDPDCEAAVTRAAEIGESAEGFTAGIRMSIARLRELSEVADVQVWLYRALPVWRLLGLDDTLYVSSFTDTWEGHESPTYKISPGAGGALYSGFRRTFADLMCSAERVIWESC